MVYSCKYGQSRHIRSCLSYNVYTIQKQENNKLKNCLSIYIMRLIHNNYSQCTLTLKSLNMTNIIIDNQPCIIYVSGIPQKIFLQITARHEQKTIDNEVKLIEQGVNTGFIFVGIYLDRWAESLMPWPDEAVSNNTDAGFCARSTLNIITKHVLPYIYNRYGQLPCILGGYSLGGLFSLWAATQSTDFTAIAAASPSVWIKEWNCFAESHPIHAQYTYLSLGNREEHARNHRMAAVGNCIRQYNDILKTQIGEDCVTLQWNNGGHFDQEDKRMANAFIWTSEQLNSR